MQSQGVYVGIERSIGHVLVADDSPENRELLTEMLVEEGHRVTPVHDGEEALRVLQERRDIDVVLLDVMMPRRSGFAVCRAVKAHPETRLIPVVLVTGLSNLDDRVQGIECGADDFLTKPVNRQELLARVRSLLRLKNFTDELENAETVLFTLALGIEAKDAYTEGHCERLSRYAVSLAKRLKLAPEYTVALRRAGVIHDIGKVGVPEHILLKPGPLTSEERRIVQQHPVIGERICAPLKSFRLVLPVIRHHHERMDGSGYPDGLKGDQIPVTARILTVVDVYDALTTARPYKPALSRDEALRTMEQEVARGWWDGRIFDEFTAMIQTQAARAG